MFDRTAWRLIAFTVIIHLVALVFLVTTGAWREAWEWLKANTFSF